ncbi:hypothetical protein BT96DRAFT_920150 [Gymnopus androsaceus JB14]|uniref:NAD(P)-binding protein n=1 Tax=Gymnopus androsaceus JB14 TaxID=1447944 RepID=A0A6A4HPR6_9AGAR|nr:hypothetical protein BT96DRAFT_920150 [Gymnopus androsaceus JB14]
MDLFKPLPISLALTAAGAAAFFRILAANRARLAQAQQDLINAKLSSTSSSYVPVAIFVGGTAGIGQGMAEAFARRTGGKCHIILIGRNEASAKAIISKFPKAAVPGAKYEFVQCDASLMGNIKQTTTELLSRLPRINFLVISAVDVRTLTRQETAEGMDSKLALFYYGRFKFIRDLTPALERARTNGEDGKVYIVAAPGKGKHIDWNDLGFKKMYSFLNIRVQIPLYLDIILQELATRSPMLTFIHAYPGTVRTNLGSHAPWPMPLILRLIFFFKYPWTLSYSESGDYMLRAMLVTAKGPGVWSVGEDGHNLPAGVVYKASEEERRRLWEHTVEETTVKERGKIDEVH